MWYGLFSLFYPLRASTPLRPEAVEALNLSDGARVLDLPCGTGQSFDFLVPAVGPTGSVPGVDQSSGMLRKAQHRTDRTRWNNVTLRQVSAAGVDSALLADALGHRGGRRAPRARTDGAAGVGSRVRGVVLATPPRRAVRALRRLCPGAHAGGAVGRTGGPGRSLARGVARSRPGATTSSGRCFWPT